MFGWEWKSGEKEKMSLNKFTHIPLLKNDAQLKQKKWQITTKKREQSPKFINKKSCQKKIHTYQKKQQQQLSHLGCRK